MEKALLKEKNVYVYNKLEVEQLLIQMWEKEQKTHHCILQFI